jgi:ferredoxin
MARSYASAARAGLPTEKPKRSVLRAEAPAWKPAPRCYHCGSAADVCPQCAQTCSYYPEWGLQPVVQDGRCSQHARYHESKAHAFFNKNMADYIPQTCASCRAEHPWQAKDTLELKGFSYERACLCCPLKSPNGGRFNVVFVRLYRYIKLGEAKSTPEQVAAWAQAAYEKEMEFSGETKRAEALKAAVLSGDPFAEPDLD